ncbi:trimethylamine methyltransferase family protein [Myxococcota bacterium]
MEVLELDTMLKYFSPHKKLVTASVKTRKGIENLAKHYENGSYVGASLSVSDTCMRAGDTVLETFLATVKKGIPFRMNAMPVGGQFGAYGMSALAAQAQAEAFFGMTLAQLIAPGIKGANGALPLMVDMGREDRGYKYGSVANALLNILVAEMNEHLGIPGVQSITSSNQTKPGLEADRQAIVIFALLKRFAHNTCQLRHLFGYFSAIIEFSIDGFMRGMDLYRRVMQDPDIRINEEVLEEAKWDPDGVEAVMTGLVLDPQIYQDSFRGLQHTLDHIGKDFIDYKVPEHDTLLAGKPKDPVLREILGL